jgi:hypothetical protein
MSRRLTSEEFAERSRTVHGPVYDYSQVKYQTSHTKVYIICPVHGPFLQKPNAHLNGQGCPDCGNIKRGLGSKDDFESFVKKARERHGDKYDYSLVRYVDSQTFVDIVCPAHGVFSQRPAAHLFKHACPLCSRKARDDKRRLGVEGFIAKAREVHGDRFDYSQVTEVTNNKQKVVIICPAHGPFKQSFNSHLNHSCQGGCPGCKKDTISKALSLTHDEFIKRAIERHGDRYSYPAAGYVSSKIKVTIFCKVHGPFEQAPEAHMLGQGCPKCAKSNLENKFAEFLDTLGVEYVRGDKKVLDGKELDFLFPGKGLAIELNGNYWHSSAMLRWKGASWVRNHQKNKTVLCEEKGVRLLHYYEADLRHSLEIVHDQVRMVLGLGTRRTYARQTSLQQLEWAQARAFLNQYHLQGAGRPGTAYGLFSEEGLVAIMVFSTVTSNRVAQIVDNVVELTRFCSSGQVVGGASKLLSAFRAKHPEVDVIISYSDNRWATGAMYRALGFKFVHTTPPDYAYISTNVHGELLHKSHFRRSMLAKKYPDQFDPALSERENCHKLGFYQIYNCGLTKWELRL